MPQNGYAGRPRNAYLLTGIVAAHAALLAAVMLAKIQVAPKPPPGGIITENIPLDPPPPPAPPPPDLKAEPRQPQTPSIMTTVDPVIDVPTRAPSVTPVPADDVILTADPVGPTIVPRADPLPTPAPAAIDPPVPPRPKPIKLRPRGNPGSWVTNADYPAAALRAEEQGRTSFALDVAADGKPSACTVTGSSGSRALDQAACRLLMQRARFNPGKDADGVATGGRYANSFSWQIPED